jgi:hypothetical protein
MFERLEGERIQREARESLARDVREPEKPPSRAEQIFATTLVIAIGASWYFRPKLGAVFSVLTRWPIDHSSILLFQILFVVIIVAVAISLYLLRRKRRRLYAMLEIAFGVSASIFAANGITAATDYDSQFRNLVAALGGIYIIIRGLDNWFYKPPAV